MYFFYLREGFLNRVLIEKRYWLQLYMKVRYYFLEIVLVLEYVIDLPQILCYQNFFHYTQCLQKSFVVCIKQGRLYHDCLIYRHPPQESVAFVLEVPVNKEQHE